MLNIPSEFGRQTVGFVTVTETGEIGFGGIREQTRTLNLVHGVRFRPLSTVESEGLTGIAGEVWKMTAPVEAAALAAASTGEVLYDGTDSPTLDDDRAEAFQVHGFNQPKPGMHGVTHHVTILCKKQRVV